MILHVTMISKCHFSASEILRSWIFAWPSTTSLMLNAEVKVFSVRLKIDISAACQASAIYAILYSLNYPRLLTVSVTMVKGINA
jgi:hypothetical protein